MYHTSEALEVEPLGRSEAKEGAAFVGDPNFIPHNIPHPHPKLGSAGREFHALVRFAQVSFTHLQLPRELRPVQQVVAHFIAHSCYQAQICEAGEKWRL